MSVRYMIQFNLLKAHRLLFEQNKLRLYLYAVLYSIKNEKCFFCCFILRHSLFSILAYNCNIING